MEGKPFGYTPQPNAQDLINKMFKVDKKKKTEKLTEKQIFNGIKKTKKSKKKKKK